MNSLFNSLFLAGVILLTATVSPAAILSFRNIRPTSATAGNWRIDGGSNFDSTTNSVLYSNNGTNTDTVQAGSWTIVLTGVDILSDGGSYDITVAIDMNGFNAAVNDNSDRFETDFNDSTNNGANPNNASTITFSNVGLAIVNASGANNAVDADDLESGFLGFTGFRAFNVGVNDEANVSGTAVAGGAITPVTVSRATTGGNNAANFTIDPAEDFTIEATAAGEIRWRSFDGSFEIVPIPEPSTTTSVLLGAIMLIMRRKRKAV